MSKWDLHVYPRRDTGKVYSFIPSLLNPSKYSRRFDLHHLIHIPSRLFVMTRRRTPDCLYLRQDNFGVRFPDYSLVSLHGTVTDWVSEGRRTWEAKVCLVVNTNKSLVDRQVAEWRRSNVWWSSSGPRRDSLVSSGPSNK